MSIPASTIVSVVPSVLAAGGNPLALNGLLLSQNPLLPSWASSPTSPAITSFTSAALVGAYFGTYNWAGTATCSANTLTVTSTSQGTLAVGQMLQSSLAVGLPPGTYITAIGTYSTATGVGTVTISGAGFTQATSSPITSVCLEYAMASVYFSGYNGGTTKPTSLSFAKYGSYASGFAGFLRGLAKPGMLTTSVLQAVTGSLTVNVAGLAFTAASVASAFSGASSPSAAATALTALFTFTGNAVGTTITWNSNFNAFVVNAPLIAGTAAIGYATGTAAPLLGLDAPSAGVLSQGTAAAMSPATAMANIILAFQNWATFGTCFEPVASDKAAFATWTSGTGGQFAYVCYDSDATIVTSSPSATCIGQYTKTNSLNGTIPVYQDPLAAAFAMGAFASVNFNQTNGRISLAFKSGSGITPAVTDPTSAANALANEYNFYGAYATANQGFNVFYNGQISGTFNWADSYVNAIWLNSALQLALMTMFTSTPAVPYNNAGYAMIEAACNGVIAQALNAGVINIGVPLTSTQIAQVNSAAGVAIDQVLATRGYYLQVLPASGTSRNNRTTPPCTLWYMDGGSVNQLNLASIDIQ